MQAALGWDGLVAADFAGKAAPAERRPDQRAHALIERERHELPLVIAADQRVVDLVADVLGPAVTLGYGKGLHKVPAGKVGAGDVADLAGEDEVVERAEGLVDRG